MTDKRRPNFQCSIEVLIEHSHKFCHILNSKHRDVETNAKKDRVWREISAAVSVVGVAQRSDDECCKKASNLQSLVKTKAANIRSESSKTGSGPPPKPLSNQEETILATLPLKSVYGIDEGMNTSESQETMTEEVCPEMNEDEAVEEVTEEAAVTPVPHSDRFPPPVFNGFYLLMKQVKVRGKSSCNASVKKQIQTLKTLLLKRS